MYGRSLKEHKPKQKSIHTMIEDATEGDRQISLGRELKNFGDTTEKALFQVPLKMTIVAG